MAGLLRRLSGSAMIAGAMMLAVGAYHAFVRAGIPYQDPTVEMQIRYAIDLGVGRTLMTMGGATAAAGCLGRLLLGRGARQ